MKTLLVGDLHLKMSLILPIIEEKASNLNCQRIILLGDYMDAHGQENNSKLYAYELQFLIDWKKKMQNKGLEIITLLGNHDAPYLVERPEHYSTHNMDLFWAINENLLELGLQVSYWLDDILVSHAGYVINQEPKDWHLRVIDKNDIVNLVELTEHVGELRGGQYALGSPIWADYTEVVLYPNPKYLKQIVGHSPQRKISLNFPLIPIDTFSTGNGDLLMYDDETKYFSIVKTDWENDDNFDKIQKLFNN